MKTRKLNPKENENKNCCVEFIKKFDFYKDLPDNLTEPTLTGSFMSCVFITVFFLLLIYRT